jgi:hypothetical protein
VLGNLMREEARTYFFDYVLPSCTHPPGANGAWERVYNVCGGNPGLLLNCAGEAADFDSWELGAQCVLALLCFASIVALTVACTQAATPSCKLR